MFFHNNMVAVKSQVIEIKPPLDSAGNFILEAGKAFGLAEPTWKYAPEKGFYSKAMSSAIRMTNGNTMVHETYPTDDFWQDGTIPQTDSRIREVSKNGEILWMDTLKLKSGMGFNPAKMMYYPSTHAGVRKVLNLPPVQVAPAKGTAAAPGAARPRISKSAGSITFSDVLGCTITCVNLQGTTVIREVSPGATFDLSTRRLPAGVYHVAVAGNNQTRASVMVTVAR
jgi:hypothetical protein